MVDVPYTFDNNSTLIMRSNPTDFSDFSGAVVEWLRQRTLNLRVEGSNPTRGDSRKVISFC